MTKAMTDFHTNDSQPTHHILSQTGCAASQLLTRQLDSRERLPGGDREEAARPRYPPTLQRQVWKDTGSQNFDRRIWLVLFLGFWLVSNRHPGQDRKTRYFYIET